MGVLPPPLHSHTLLIQRSRFFGRLIKFWDQYSYERNQAKNHQQSAFEETCFWSWTCSFSSALLFSWHFSSLSFYVLVYVDWGNSDCWKIPIAGNCNDTFLVDGDLVFLRLDAWCPIFINSSCSFCRMTRSRIAFESKDSLIESLDVLTSLVFLLVVNFLPKVAVNTMIKRI